MRAFATVLLTYCAFYASEAAAQARTCSNAHGICVSRCTGPGENACRAECGSYQSACLRSGIWQSRNFRQEGLERR